MDADVNRMTDLIGCMRVRPLLQSYLDGEFDDDQGAALVARHLRACRRCGRAADSIEELKRHVERFRREPSPADVERVERIIDELTERADRRDG
jgi:anti-sigma factor RsiW